MTNKINLFENRYSDSSSPILNPIEERLDTLTKPLDDFVEFSHKFDPSNRSTSLLNRVLSNIELFGGLSRIGNAIEKDQNSISVNYFESGKEIARYASSQVAGVSLGGLGLFALGLTGGPLGLLGAAGGYLGGSYLGGKAFDYVFG